MKYYAGIGSRETPKDIQDLMTKLATTLESKEYILRSGGADGADTAFENGVLDDNNKEIYLPWKNFNNSNSPYYNFDNIDEATKIAKQFHPKFDNLSTGAKKLITRNTYQVLGLNLNTPSEFIICWTIDGKMKGGTAQALRIANSLEIPIYNLGKKSDYKQTIDRFLSNKKSIFNL